MIKGINMNSTCLHRFSKAAELSQDHWGKFEGLKHLPFILTSHFLSCKTQQRNACFRPLVFLYTELCPEPCALRIFTISAHVPHTSSSSPYPIQHNGSWARRCSVLLSFISLHVLRAPQGPPGSSCSMLRLSNRHYVNWHVQCNSVIRLNEEKCYLLTAPRGAETDLSICPLLCHQCQLSEFQEHVWFILLSRIFNTQEPDGGLKGFKRLICYLKLSSNLF